MSNVKKFYNDLTWPIKFIKHIYIYSQILSYLSIKIDIYNFRIFIQRHFFGGGRIGSIVRWRKSCFFAWLILNKMSNIVSQRPYPGRLVWNTLHHRQASLWRGLSYREHAAKSQSLQFCDGNKLTQTRMPYLKVLLPQHTITTLQNSCLGNILASSSWSEKPGGLQPMGSQRVDTTEWLPHTQHVRRGLWWFSICQVWTAEGPGRYPCPILTAKQVSSKKVVTD